MGISHSRQHVSVPAEAGHGDIDILVARICLFADPLHCCPRGLINKTAGRYHAAAWGRSLECQVAALEPPVLRPGEFTHLGEHHLLGVCEEITSHAVIKHLLEGIGMVAPELVAVADAGHALDFVIFVLARLFEGDKGRVAQDLDLDGAYLAQETLGAGKHEELHAWPALFVLVVLPAEV